MFSPTVLLNGACGRRADALGPEPLPVSIVFSRLAPYVSPSVMVMTTSGTLNSLNPNVSACVVMMRCSAANAAGMTVAPEGASGTFWRARMIASLR